MSKHEDIKDEKLIYTCNCGWIDLGHMGDSSEYEFVGPRNLWKQIREGDSTPEARSRWLCSSSPVGTLCLPRLDPTSPITRFPDRAPGFKVT